MTHRARLPLLAAALVLALSGCAVGGLSVGPGDQAAPSLDGSGCPTGNRGTSIVDYVDFVRYQGRMYTTRMLPPAASEPPPARGPQVATVRCELSKIQPEPEYTPRDGDAGFLPAGTGVYGIRGYPTTFRLAALREGRYTIYEVDSAPEARTGGDLLPLTGLVRRIDIMDADTTTRVLASVTDQRQIAALVDALVKARVDQDVNVDVAKYFLRFSLADGTTVLRAWNPKVSIVDRGIFVPRSFSSALESRLRRR